MLDEPHGLTRPVTEAERDATPLHGVARRVRPGVMTWRVRLAYDPGWQLPGGAAGDASPWLMRASRSRAGARG